MSHQHVPSSSFHQVNKGHSGGKHDSKGAIRKRQKGKVSSAGGENRGSVKSLSKVLSKSDKKAVQQQYSKNKKLAVLERKRFGTAEGAPKIVALISLGELDLTKMQHMLLSHLGKAPEELESLVSSCTISLNTKQRMTLVKVPRETNAILDIAKVADILLLVVPADEGIDELGDHFISLIKAQGLPNVFGIVEGLDNIPEKKRHETKKEYIKILHQYFPGEPRVLPFDNATDAGQVIRFVENCTVHPVHWREKRPYVLVQNVSSDEGEKEVGTIKVTGYLRGANMSANQLVHIPGYGDFQLKKIQVLNDPHPIGRPKDAPELGESEIKSVEPDNKQESLVTENVPDLLLNEQTWPTPEELSGKKKVPKGTSAYQASWIVDEEDRAAHENHDEEGDENMDDEEHAEAREEDDEDDEEEEEIDMDEKTQKGEDDEDDSTTITEASRADRSTRQESDLMYPDEVDCPIDTPARLRFQKYRGLKSFRTTTWDPKENLPLDYARIFQFANFNRSMNNAMETSEFPVPVGTYVTLHIANVPMEYLHAYTKNPERPLAIGGLFKYENKMSVLQFHILKHQTYEDPVQSKDTLVFHVGMRRYTVQPIFSTINPGCAKQKFERFLQPGRPSCATIYGPATFPPNPLLVFTTSGELVATGTLHAVDPDRIVVKKIVITGTPAKVHKRGAVIRDMFYFPEDANWFRPVELWTKNGKVGHIKESVGTHGLIKCTFDTPVNQNDTVCLSLYKRVFPKWPKISPSAQFVKNDSKSTTETEMEN